MRIIYRTKNSKINLQIIKLKLLEKEKFLLRFQSMRRIIKLKAISSQRKWKWVRKLILKLNQFSDGRSQLDLLVAIRFGKFRVKTQLHKLTDFSLGVCEGASFSPKQLFNSESGTWAGAGGNKEREGYRLTVLNLFMNYFVLLPFRPLP